LPPLLERIGLKNKNATDATDATDSKSLADDTFELKRATPVHDRELSIKSVKSVESVAFLFDFSRSESHFRLHLTGQKPS
jgi:hypothetical protein